MVMMKLMMVLQGRDLMQRRQYSRESCMVMQERIQGRRSRRCVSGAKSNDDTGGSDGRVAVVATGFGR